MGSSPISGAQNVFVLTEFTVCCFFAFSVSVSFFSTEKKYNTFLSWLQISFMYGSSTLNSNTIFLNIFFYQNILQFLSKDQYPLHQSKQCAVFLKRANKQKINTKFNEIRKENDPLFSS